MATKNTMTDKERIKAEINKIMSEEMQLYKEACNDGCGEQSASPVVYTRLQGLLSFIDSLSEEPTTEAIEQEQTTNDAITGKVYSGLIKENSKWVEAGWISTSVFPLEKYGLKIFDKVKLIIIKEK